MNDFVAWVVYVGRNDVAEALQSAHSAEEAYYLVNGILHPSSKKSVVEDASAGTVKVETKRESIGDLKIEKKLSEPINSEKMSAFRMIVMIVIMSVLLFLVNVFFLAGNNNDLFTKIILVVVLDLFVVLAILLAGHHRK